MYFMSYVSYLCFVQSSKVLCPTSYVNIGVQSPMSNVLCQYRCPKFYVNIGVQSPMSNVLCQYRCPKSYVQRLMSISVSKVLCQYRCPKSYVQRLMSVSVFKVICTISNVLMLTSSVLFPIFYKAENHENSILRFSDLRNT